MVGAQQERLNADLQRTMGRAKPHPLNVIGDFYVEDGCCTACDVPRTEAPELFGMTDSPDFHCFVQRQPTTDAEHEQMLAAIACAELRCIHYRGANPATMSRLSAMGEMDVCDASPPEGTELGLRLHVTFTSTQEVKLHTLSSSLRRFLISQRSEYSQITFPWLSLSPKTVSYRGNGRRWRKVVFGKSKDRVHVTHNATRDVSVSRYISRWLKTLEAAQDIRWYTDRGWHETGVWHTDYF